MNGDITSELDPAFNLIRNLLSEKDTRIKNLEVENFSLKKEIEFLNQQLNKQMKFSNNVNIYSENENIIKNSPNPSPTKIKNFDANSNSRQEIKIFLNEVKEKIPTKDFKDFIKYIKILTDKNNTTVNQKEIFDNVKILFGYQYKDLYIKFEEILSIKK